MLLLQIDKLRLLCKIKWIYAHWWAGDTSEVKIKSDSNTFSFVSITFTCQGNLELSSSHNLPFFFNIFSIILSCKLSQLIFFFSLSYIK